MVTINDEVFSYEQLSTNDCLIATIGYEDRSTYLIDSMKSILNPSNILVFCFSDLSNQERVLSKVTELQEGKIRVEFVRYEESEKVYSLIREFLLVNKERHEKIYIDYSAMPRTWYSKLPINLASLTSETKYLYVVGEYPRKETEYPCAGIDDIYTIIGKPSLSTNSRLHVIGIGYDSTRTMALITRLDPDAYAICSARHSDDDEMERKVQKVNKPIIDQALFSCTLMMDDFSYMVARLSEIAYEYSRFGDVVFVPDGPKPLIMAMSLIPQIVGIEGVVCIHVSRNPIGYEFVNVLPTETILSFSIDLE